MTATDESEPVDFSLLVSAEQALDWLTPVLGGRMQSKAEIADLMRDGLLSVFARRAWDSRTRSAIAAWKQSPDEDDDFTALETDLIVQPWVWRGSSYWQDDQVDWRWPSGRFTVLHQGKPWRRILVEHVHFDPAEIKQLAVQRSADTKVLARPFQTKRADQLDFENADDSTLEGKGKTPSGRGRHARGRAWAAVCMEIFRLKQEGRLSKRSINGVQNFAHELSKVSATSGEVLQQGTLEPLVTKLIKAGFIPE